MALNNEENVEIENPQKAIVEEGASIRVPIAETFPMEQENFDTKLVPQSEEAIKDEIHKFITSSDEDLEENILDAEQLKRKIDEKQDLDDQNKLKALSGRITIIDINHLIEIGKDEKDISLILQDFAYNANKKFSLIIKLPENENQGKMTKLVELANFYKRNNGSVKLANNNDEVVSISNALYTPKNNLGINLFSNNQNLEETLLLKYGIHRCNQCSIKEKAADSEENELTSITFNQLKTISKLGEEGKLLDSFKMLKADKLLMFKNIEKDLATLHLDSAVNLNKKVSRAIETAQHNKLSEQKKFDNPDNWYQWGSFASGAFKTGSTLIQFGVQGAWTYYITDFAARSARFGFQMLATSGKINKIDITEGNRVMSEITEMYVNLKKRGVKTKEALFFAVTNQAVTRQSQVVLFDEKKSSATMNKYKSFLWGLTPVLLLGCSIVSGSAIQGVIDSNIDSIDLEEFKYLDDLKEDFTVTLSMLGKGVSFINACVAFSTDVQSRRKLDTQEFGDNEKIINFQKNTEIYAKYKTIEDFREEVTKRTTSKEFFDLFNQLNALKEPQMEKFPNKGHLARKITRDNKKPGDFIILDGSIFFEKGKSEAGADVSYYFKRNFDLLRNFDPQNRVIITKPKNCSDDNNAILDELKKYITDNHLDGVISFMDDNINQDVPLSFSIIKNDPELIAEEAPYQKYVYIGKEPEDLKFFRRLQEEENFKNFLSVRVNDSANLSIPTHLQIEKLQDIMPYFEPEVSTYSSIKDSLYGLKHPLTEPPVRINKKFIADYILPNSISNIENLPVKTSPMSLAELNKQPENLVVLDLESFTKQALEGNKDENKRETLFETQLEAVKIIVDGIREENKEFSESRVKNPELYDKSINKYVIIADPSLTKEFQKVINSDNLELKDGVHDSLRLIRSKNQDENIFESVEGLFESSNFKSIRVFSNNSEELRKSIKALSSEKKHVVTFGAPDNEYCINQVESVNEALDHITREPENKTFNKTYVDQYNIDYQTPKQDTAWEKLKGWKWMFQSEMNQLTEEQSNYILNLYKIQPRSTFVETLKSVGQIQDTATRGLVSFLNIGAYFYPEIINQVINLCNNVNQAAGFGTNVLARQALMAHTTTLLTAKFFNKITYDLAKLGFNQKDTLKLAEKAMDEFNELIRLVTTGELEKCSEKKFKKIGATLALIGGISNIIAPATNYAYEEDKKEIWRDFGYNTTSWSTAPFPENMTFKRPENVTGNATYPYDVYKALQNPTEWFYGSRTIGTFMFSTLLISKGYELFFNKSWDQRKARMIFEIDNAVNYKNVVSFLKKQIREYNNDDQNKGNEISWPNNLDFRESMSEDKVSQEELPTSHSKKGTSEDTVSRGELPTSHSKTDTSEDTVSQEELPTSHSKFRKEFTEFKDKYEAKDIENAFRLRNYKPPTDPQGQDKAHIENETLGHLKSAAITRKKIKGEATEERTSPQKRKGKSSLNSKVPDSAKAPSTRLG